MEIRRGAIDLVLRTSNPIAVSRSSPVSSLACLRISRLQTPHRPSARLQGSTTPRTFSSTPQRRDQGPAAARKEEEDDFDPPPQDQSQQQDGPTIRKINRTDRIPYNPRKKVPGASERLGFLRPLQREQQLQKPLQDQPTPPASSSTPGTRPASLDEFLATFRPRTPSPDLTAPLPSNNRSDASRMIQPSRYANERPGSAANAPNLAVYVAPDLSPSPVRLGPRLGRTVAVNARRNVDVAGAFRMMEMRCRQNRVRADMNAQRFHERPGLRRKRLVSVRWRKRFRGMFQQTVARVEALKRQGW